uniref:Uncharacterized protein n=1 Tax=Arundo donax TaxID=35708 RepID=A0A0A9BF77_ARUDO
MRSSHAMASGYIYMLLPQPLPSSTQGFSALSLVRILRNLLTCPAR